MHKPIPYNLIILGDDSAVLDLIEAAGGQFARIAWVTSASDRPRLPWNVDCFCGEARFAGDRLVEIVGADATVLLQAERIVIATGTRLKLPGWLPSSDHLHLPSTMLPRLLTGKRVAILGMGKSGRRMRDCLVDRAAHLDCIESRSVSPSDLLFSEQRRHERYHFGDGLAGVELVGEKLRLFLESGNELLVDDAVVCLGREGNTKQLALDRVGLMADDSGRIWCDTNYETWSDGIYAFGSVVGYLNYQDDQTTAVARLMHALMRDEQSPERVGFPARASFTTQTGLSAIA